MSAWRKSLMDMADFDMIDTGRLKGLYISDIAVVGVEFISQHTIKPVLRLRPRARSGARPVST